jgi:hypothetical protein
MADIFDTLFEERPERVSVDAVTDRGGLGSKFIKLRDGSYYVFWRGEDLREDIFLDETRDAPLTAITIIQDIRNSEREAENPLTEGMFLDTLRELGLSPADVAVELERIQPRDSATDPATPDTPFAPSEAGE